MTQANPLCGLACPEMIMRGGGHKDRAARVFNNSNTDFNLFFVKQYD